MSRAATLPTGAMRDEGDTRLGEVQTEGRFNQTVRIGSKVAFYTAVTAALVGLGLLGAKYAKIRNVTPEKLGQALDALKDEQAHKALETIKQTSPHDKKRI